MCSVGICQPGLHERTTSIVTIGAKATASVTNFWPESDADCADTRPRVIVCTCGMQTCAQLMRFWCSSKAVSFQSTVGNSVAAALGFGLRLAVIQVGATSIKLTTRAIA